MKNADSDILVLSKENVLNVCQDVRNVLTNLYSLVRSVLDAQEDLRKMGLDAFLVHLELKFVNEVSQ